MTRTKLCDRSLPDYTRGEELFNTASHAVGGIFGVVALIVCLSLSLRSGDGWAVTGSLIYGLSMILLYTVSSVYHGLRNSMMKKVMQVVDHCTIYLLIGGTYTPILLTAVRPVSPGWAWTIFAIVWGLAVIATVFTAIDLKKYSKLSMACYIGLGWCIVLAAKTVLEIFPLDGLAWLLGGGILYTIGAALYAVGKKRRYMHSVFHLFVVAGSILHFIFIACFVLQ